MDNLLGILGIIGAVFGAIKILKDYQDRKLAETKVKAAENSAGITAIAELVKANQEIHKELESFKKELKEGEKNWEHKFETMREHCEKVMQNAMEFVMKLIK